MIYKGKATCKIHGEFEWQIVDNEKIGKNSITKNVKDYDIDLKLIIANCPEGCSVEIYNYNFDKAN